jgi:hypothetical protein
VTVGKESAHTLHQHLAPARSAVTARAVGVLQLNLLLRLRVLL